LGEREIIPPGHPQPWRSERPAPVPSAVLRADAAASGKVGRRVRRPTSAFVLSRS
jgi:hypothetical protein